MGADALIGEVVAAPASEVPATGREMEPSDATLARLSRDDERAYKPPAEAPEVRSGCHQLDRLLCPDSLLCVAPPVIQAECGETIASGALDASHAPHRRWPSEHRCGAERRFSRPGCFFGTRLLRPDLSSGPRPGQDWPLNDIAVKLFP